MNKQEKLKMAELRKKGYSYLDIGKLFGVSRQRVHQILSGYGRLINSQTDNGWYGKIKVSVIDRDKACQKCGSADNLVIHHLDKDDNNNALGNLIALCHPCHGGLHGSENGGRNCQCCGKLFKLRETTSEKAYKNNICGECAILLRQLRWWRSNCEICGKEFKVRMCAVRYRDKLGRNRPRFCSHACRDKQFIGTSKGYGTT